MDDKEPGTDRTLLMMAADVGSYELVSMCINLGADIDKIGVSIGLGTHWMCAPTLIVAQITAD